jgi:hypothetical protein
MRVAAIFFLALSAAFAGAMLPHACALAAEDESAGAAMKRALPDWFDPQTREYYTMPPFVVPVIEGDAVTRQITLLVTLETMGDANREKVLANRQRLQDVFLRDIYGVLAVSRPSDRNYDNVVKIRLQRAGERVVGSGVIDDVLVKATYDRRLAPARR